MLLLIPGVTILSLVSDDHTLGKLCIDISKLNYFADFVKYK